jgi:formylglycine-generating enzyme required for sulfatase activity
VPATAVVAALLAAVAPDASRGELVAGKRAPRTREFADAGGVVHLQSPLSKMILVRASRFIMGSTPSEVLDASASCAREPLGHRCTERTFANELRAHTVELSAFWLDRTEVSVRDYTRCVELGRCRALPADGGAQRFTRPELPVTFVTWDDAQEYCAFRGARLPTEAEFERAARGATGRRYPWGYLYNSHAANHGRLGLEPTDASDGYAELAPIGSFPAGRTVDGFLDLAGNAAEWVFDLYVESYPRNTVKDPTGPDAPGSGGERVVRGGSFTNAGAWLRGAARSAADPGTRRPTLGFRCAKSATRRQEPKP